MKKIAERLNEIQKSLKAHKGQTNNFGKYKYRSCEDILEALKKHLGDDVFVTVTDDLVMIGDRFYVKATATISDGEDSIQVSAFAREAVSKKGMDESQLTGATSSYARKYALSGLFCIDDNKDADATNKHGNKAQDLKEKALKKAIEGMDLKASDLTQDQLMSFVIPMEWEHKYSGITLKDVANNITETGTAIGVEWLEKIVASDWKDKKRIQIQEVIKRFLDEVVPQFGLDEVA